IRGLYVVRPEARRLRCGIPAVQSYSGINRPVRTAPALLQEMLRTVRRRYRVPELPMRFEKTPHENASTTLAIVIEQVRVALAAGENPDERLKQRFLDALDRLIREALRPARGD